MSSLNKTVKISRVREILALIAVLLLVVIPKGGFKVSGIPITWGYIYLGFLFVVLIWSLKSSFIINQKPLICYLATLPFIAYFVIHLSIVGYDGNFGNLVAFFVSFVFLPLLFLVLLSGVLSRINIDYLEKLIYKAVLIVSIYGIILFVYKQLRGTYIEIPYLTVNAGDVGEMELKYNQRGDIFKLISTYNNGNIFGVCIMMLFPVFYRRYRKKYELYIVLLALFLTLSRTVWIGLILFFLIKYRNRVWKLVKVYLLIIVLLFLLSSLLLTQYFQYGSLGNFIMDANFGGRIYQIREALGFSFFGVKTFVGIDEIAYLSIYKQFGLVGMVLFCLSMFTPFYVYIHSKTRNRVYFTGVIIYWVLCASDGCMLFLPTLAFYYFIVCMSLVTPNPPYEEKVAESVNVNPVLPD